MKKISGKITVPLGILSLAAIAAGVALTVTSLLPRAGWIAAVNEYRSRAYARTETYEVDIAYSGYPIMIAGALTYDEGGASDPVFGIATDSAALMRVAEMYQLRRGDDGELAGEWSDELIETEEKGENLNPDAFPANIKTNIYSAHAVKVGEIAVTDAQLAALADSVNSVDNVDSVDGVNGANNSNSASSANGGGGSSAWERIEELANVDVRGYHTEGGYITNAESLAEPKVGDVRISYKRLTVGEITIAGMQRSVGTPGVGVVEWNATNKTKIMHVFAGKLDFDEVVRRLYNVEEADKVGVWALMGGLALTLAGMTGLIASYSALTGYKPKVEIKTRPKPDKTKPTTRRQSQSQPKSQSQPANQPTQTRLKLSDGGATVAHGVIAGLLTGSLAGSSAWTAVDRLWLAISLVAAVTYAYFAISDVVKRTPKRKKVEPEYTPIIIKKNRDDFDR